MRTRLALDQALTIASLETELPIMRKMLEEVVFERRQAQAVLSELALGRGKSALEDAAVKRTISMRVGVALAAVIGAIATGITLLATRAFG